MSKRVYSMSDDPEAEEAYRRGMIGVLVPVCLLVVTYVGALVAFLVSR